MKYNDDCMCGFCGLPMNLDTVGVRHMGTTIAHNENSCYRLLKDRIRELEQATAAPEPEGFQEEFSSWRASIVPAGQCITYEAIAKHFYMRGQQATAEPDLQYISDLSYSAGFKDGKEEATAAPDPNAKFIEQLRNAGTAEAHKMHHPDAPCFPEHTLYWIAADKLKRQATAAPEPQLTWIKTEDEEPPMYETIIGYYLCKPDNIYKFTTRVPEGYKGAGTQHAPAYWAKLNPPVRSAGGRE